LATTTDGWCTPGFEPVRDALVDQLAQPDELGAAAHVVLDGDVVVDLWGGWADRDRTRPWQRDTLVNAYSVGKPLVATLLLELVDDNLVDLDAPVARYWPDFAARGKERVTVRHALCHRAGVPAITHPVTNQDLWDFDAMCAALATSEPFWRPAENPRHAYHTNTYGHLVGGIIRHVTGELPGTRLARLTERHGADVHFGVGDPDLARCADVFFDAPGSGEGSPDDALGVSLAAEVEGLEPDRRMELMGYANPPGYSSMGVVNTRAWGLAQVPSTNGHMTAAGIARLYAAILDGQVLSDAVLAEATSAQSSGHCPVLGQDVTFGLGFQPWTEARPFGANPGGYGHYGTGGSLGFADPSIGLALGYVTNHVIPRWQNPYNRAVVTAVYDCL
jgi:CubicO group peptidase (beta-lactamase class C family)